MSKIIALLVAVSLVCLTGTGCVSAHGNKSVADVQTTSQIQKGKTTKAEVRSMLGEPGTKSEMADGSEMWSYSYYRGQTRLATFIPYVGLLFGGHKSESHSLGVGFDPNGVVTTVTRSNSSGSGGGIQDTFK